MNLHDEIAAVAYALFEARGCIHGCDLDDWLNAEKMVLGGHAGQENEEPEEEDNSQGEAAAEGEKVKESEETEENQESGFD